MMDTAAIELGTSRVLAALGGDTTREAGHSLTLAQLRVKTEMPPEELREVLAILRTQGSVVRLHTVIDSYSVHRPTLAV